MHALKQDGSIATHPWTQSKSPLHSALLSQPDFSFLQRLIAHAEAWHTEHAAPLSQAPLSGPPPELVVKPLDVEPAPVEAVVLVPPTDVDALVPVPLTTPSHTHSSKPLPSSRQTWAPGMLVPGQLHATAWLGGQSSATPFFVPHAYSAATVSPRNPSVTRDFTMSPKERSTSKCARGARRQRPRRGAATSASSSLTERAALSGRGAEGRLPARPPALEPPCTS